MHPLFFWLESRAGARAIEAGSPAQQDDGPVAIAAVDVVSGAAPNLTEKGGIPKMAKKSKGGKKAGKKR